MILRDEETTYEEAIDMVEKDGMCPFKEDTCPDDIIEPLEGNDLDNNNLTCFPCIKRHFNKED